MTSPAVGDDVSAGNTDNIVTNINFLLNRPLFLGAQSTGQSIPNNATTALSLDTNVYDSHSGHSTTTNNSRYTCPAGCAGWYDLDAEVTFPVNASGRRIIVFRVNGVVASAGPQAEQPPTSAGTVLTLCHEYSVFLNAGDYVECYLLQTSGGALVLPGGTSQNAFMRVEWVRS